MVSMEETPGGSHPGLNDSQNFLCFNWTDSTNLRLAKQDPFACAMLDELDEGTVGLSREQSSSSEGLLFSDSDEVAESEDEGMTTKKVCGKEEDVVLGCSILRRGAERPEFWVLLIWLEPGMLHGCTMMQQYAFHVSFARYCPFCTFCDLIFVCSN